MFFLKVISVSLFCFVLIAGLGFALFRMEYDLLALSQEGALLENLSLIFGFLALFFGGFHAFSSKNIGWLLFCSWVLIIILREIDGHKMVTSDSFLKTRFYLSPDIPLIEKIFGTSVIILLIAILLKTILWAVPVLKDNWNEIFRRKYKEYALLLIFLSFALFSSGKILDSAFRILPAIEIYKDVIGSPFRFIEEACETLAMFFLLLFTIVLGKTEKGLNLSDRIRWWTRQGLNL